VGLPSRTLRCVPHAQEDGSVALNNHMTFTVLWDREPTAGRTRIVGFEVEPSSVKHRYEGAWNITGATPSHMPRTHISLELIWHRPSVQSSAILTRFRAADVLPQPNPCTTCRSELVKAMACTWSIACGADRCGAADPADVRSERWQAYDGGRATTACAMGRGGHVHLRCPVPGALDRLWADPAACLTPVMHRTAVSFW